MCSAFLGFLPAPAADEDDALLVAVDDEFVAGFALLALFEALVHAVVLCWAGEAVLEYEQFVGVLLCIRRTMPGI